jgi:hypothetical protein
MQVRLNRRISHGLTLLGSYTYSKALDESSEIAAFTGAVNFVTDPRNPHLDYGPADFDQKHRLVASYVYELPVGKGKKFSLGVANWILGDWKASGVITLAGGVPASIFCCSSSSANDLSGNPFANRLRANISAPNAGFHKSLTEWYDISRYSVPALGTFGNQSRNTIRIPMTRQANISFLKDISLFERHKFEYRLDIFNFLSSWHTGGRFPVDTVGPASTSFGSILPLTAPFNAMGERVLWTSRTIQMALTYRF